MHVPVTNLLHFGYLGASEIPSPCASGLEGETEARSLAWKEDFSAGCPGCRQRPPSGSRQILSLCPRGVRGRPRAGSRHHSAPRRSESLWEPRPSWQGVGDCRSRRRTRSWPKRGCWVRGPHPERRGQRGQPSSPGLPMSGGRWFSGGSRVEPEEKLPRSPTGRLVTWTRQTPGEHDSSSRGLAASGLVTALVLTLLCPSRSGLGGPRGGVCAGSRARVRGAGVVSIRLPSRTERRAWSVPSPSPLPLRPCPLCPLPLHPLPLCPLPLHPPPSPPSLSPPPPSPSLSLSPPPLPLCPPSIPSLSVPSPSIPALSIPSLSVPILSAPPLSPPLHPLPLHHLPLRPLPLRPPSIPSPSIPSLSIPSSSIPSLSVPSPSVPSLSLCCPPSPRVLALRARGGPGLHLIQLLMPRVG